MQLLHAFHVPFNYLLMALAVVALFTEDYRAATVISLMVLLSGTLRFWQEFRSNQAAEKLRAMVRTTATVCRPRSEPTDPPDHQPHPSRPRPRSNRPHPVKRFRSANSSPETSSACRPATSSPPTCG